MYAAMVGGSIRNLAFLRLPTQIVLRSVIKNSRGTSLLTCICERERQCFILFSVPHLILYARV